MSRNVTKLTETTSMIYSVDVALGPFIDVIDTRYDKDPSGEGFLVEWSSEFGFDTNAIDIKIDELPQTDIVKEKVEIFLKKTLE